MPMPVQQFQRGPGVLAGISAGQNIMQRLLTDPTQKSLLQAQLQRQQLLAQEQQEKLKTLPQTLQAQLALAQAQPAFTEAQTAFTQAGVPLRGAQTGLAEAQTRFMPLKEAIAAQAAMNASKMQSRYNRPQYQLRQLLSVMTPAQKANVQAQYPRAYGQMVGQTMQQVLFPGTQAQDSILTPEFLQKFGLGTGAPTVAAGIPPVGGGVARAPSEVPFQTSTQSISPLLMGGPKAPPGIPEGAPTPAQVAPAPTPLIPGATPLVAAVKPTEAQLKTDAKIAKMSVNKYLAVTAQRNKYAAARSITGMLNKPTIRRLLELGTQYSGLYGKMSGKALALKNPELYSELKTLAGPAMTILQGNLKNMEGLMSTKEGVALGRDYFNSFRDQISSDPMAALTALNNLTSLLDDEKSSIQPQAQPIYAVGGVPTEKTIKPFTLPSQRPRAAKTAEMVSVIRPDGRSGSIPRDQLAAAINAGYRRAQ